MGVTIVDAQDLTVALKDGSLIGFISPVMHNRLSAAWHRLGSSRRAASVYGRAAGKSYSVTFSGRRSKP
jgi:hypothetical protein